MSSPKRKIGEDGDAKSALKQQKTENAASTTATAAAAPHITPLVKHTAFDLKAAAAAAEADAVPHVPTSNIFRSGRPVLCQIADSCRIGEIVAEIEEVVDTKGATKPGTTVPMIAVALPNGDMAKIPPIDLLILNTEPLPSTGYSNLDIVFLKSHGPGSDLCEWIIRQKRPDATIVRVSGPWTELPMSADHVSMCAGKRIACVGFMPNHDSLTKLTAVAQSLWMVNHFIEGTKSFRVWMPTSVAGTPDAACVFADLSAARWSAAMMLYAALFPAPTDGVMPWFMEVMDKHEVAPARKSKTESTQWLALTEHAPGDVNAFAAVIRGGSHAAYVRGLELSIDHFKRDAYLIIVCSRHREALTVENVDLHSIRYITLCRPDDWKHITSIPFTAHELFPDTSFVSTIFAMVQYDEKKNETHFSLRNGVGNTTDLQALAQHWRKDGGGAPDAVRIVLPGKLASLPDPKPRVTLSKLLPEHSNLPVTVLLSLTKRFGQSEHALYSKALIDLIIRRRMKNIKESKVSVAQKGIHFVAPAHVGLTGCQLMELTRTVSFPDGRTIVEALYPFKLLADSGFQVFADPAVEEE